MSAASEESASSHCRAFFVIFFGLECHVFSFYAREYQGHGVLILSQSLHYIDLIYIGPFIEDTRSVQDFIQGSSIH